MKYSNDIFNDQQHQTLGSKITGGLNKYILKPSINFIRDTGRAIFGYTEEKYVDVNGNVYAKSETRSGTYDVFIDCLETVIEKEAYSEFKEAFSIENMKSLVNKNVHNFGGDFKRIFNSEIRWISVHMLYNESKSEKEKTEVVLAFQDISYEKERELENEIFKRYI